MKQAARSVVRSAQRCLDVVTRNKDGTRILCYHLVGAGVASVVDIEVERFRGQLEALAEVPSYTAAEAGARLGAGSSDPAVVLTFDDAFGNFHEVVLPELVRLEMRATLFVPVGFVDGGPSPLSGVTLPACSWGQLREVCESGLVEIGSHTVSHPDLRSLPDVELRDELRRSRATLEDRLGVAVETFCYPRALWNSEVEVEVAREYRYAVTGGGRRLLPGNTRRHRLQRTSVRGDVPMSIGSWLESPIWLEEAAADAWRRARR